MHVLATAGHVDHGKSTLVRALTGMEPDRFAEEKRRGMTIDLGYAWTDLPSGAQLAIVDVPGHERFIATMLAGLGPAPAVLFVVAADEGWSRQSEEHLAAIAALQVRHGLLAVTRSDLAGPEPARDDALARLAATSLGDVEAVAVSARTGAGLGDLRAALDRLVTSLPAPDTDAPVRLWLDRSFSVRGAGTVVTGTLATGRIRVGDELALADRTVTVRGVQTTGVERAEVGAVARVALNLRGVKAESLGRGDALLTPGAWHTTEVLDVRLSSTDVPTELVLHAGTASVPVRVRPLDAGHARLTLAHALPLRAGDRAVLRDPGRHAVAAGVLVLDAEPPPLRRRGAAAARAAALAGATGIPDAVLETRRRGAVRVEHLARLGAVPVADPAVHRLGGWLVHDDTWQRWLTATPAALDARAAADPLDPAPSLGAFGHDLGLPDDPAVVRALVAAAGLAILDGRVTRPGARARPQDVHPGVRALVERLATDPFAAPERSDLAALGLGNRQLTAAERAGLLLRVSPDIVLAPDAAGRAAALLATLEQPFTTSAARQALGTTRRVAIPLLEHLDDVGLTVRVDATHRLVRS